MVQCPCLAQSERPRLLAPPGRDSSLWVVLAAPPLLLGLTCGIGCLGWLPRAGAKSSFLINRIPLPEVCVAPYQGARSGTLAFIENYRVGCTPAGRWCGPMGRTGSLLRPAASRWKRQASPDTHVQVNLATTLMGSRTSILDIWEGNRDRKAPLFLPRLSPMKPGLNPSLYACR